MQENTITMYNVNDLAQIFKCGITQAYKIANANGFPAVRLGGKILVEKKALESWLDKYKGKKVHI